MSGIQLQAVSKVYPNGFQAIHGVDLEIHDGEFMVFVGPSGCAKSTLLRMIAGLEDITHGHIAIGEKCVNDLLPKERGVAMVFQNYALYPHMTIYKNMAFSLLGKMSKEEIDIRVREAAHKLEIETLLDKKPGQLSGGQCQRLALARALLHDSAVYIFDEATSNIDAESENDIMREIHSLAKTKTAILISHRLANVVNSDRIYVMEKGAVAETGSHGELLKNDGVYKRLWEAQQALENFKKEETA